MQGQLFETIAGLSYAGDPRMLVGEDNNKVRNIVQGNKDGFQQLYESVMPRFSETLSTAVLESQPAGETSIEQDTSSEARTMLLADVPDAVARRCAAGCHRRHMAPRCLTADVSRRSSSMGAAAPGLSGDAEAVQQ